MATSSEAKSKAYFSTLDGMRGIAAFLIVIRHTVPFHGIVFQESYLAVDLFFVLSGVVIANAYEWRLKAGMRSVSFAWLRLVRIYPLYILGCALGLVAVLSGSPFEGDLISATGLATMLLPYLGGKSIFPLNGVSWSLFFEWIANLIYAVFNRFLTTKVMLALMLAATFGLVRALSYCGHLDVGWNNASITFGIYRVGYSFFAGVLLYRRFLANKRKTKTLRHSTVMSLSLIAVSAALLMSSPSDSVRPAYDLVTVVILFPVIVFLALSVEPSRVLGRLYKLLGVISYGLYTLHAPIVSLVKVAMFKYSGSVLSVSQPLTPWVGLSFVALLGGVCWLADRYYDSPVRRFMFRLWEGPRVVATSNVS